jgi:hypothetical protein
MSGIPMNLMSFIGCIQTSLLDVIGSIIVKSLAEIVKI